MDGVIEAVVPRQVAAGVACQHFEMERTDLLDFGVADAAARGLAGKSFERAHHFERAFDILDRHADVFDALAGKGVQQDTTGHFANSLNQVRVTVESVGATELEMTFRNNVFQFARYQLRELDTLGVPGAWHDYNEASFRWQPSRGGPTLEVRGINSGGVGGPASAISVKFGPRTPL